MMVTPSQELVDRLQSWISGVDTTLEYRLFKNDITPDVDTVLGDFVEADFDGYGMQTAGPWDTVTYNGVDEQGETSAEELSFEVGASPAGPQDIYGYYVTLGGGTQLIFSERYAGAPATVENTGDAFKVTPHIIKRNV